MATYDRTYSKFGIAVRQGTPDVPDDGRYHVIVDGEIVLSTRVEAAALLEFEERRDERMARGREALQRELALRDAQRFRNEVLGDKAARKAKQGGRGKGGVGG